MIGHLRSIVLKIESTLCQSAADEMYLSMKVCTLCSVLLRQGAGGQLHFSVKVSRSLACSWKNGSATAKLKLLNSELGDQKVMP